MRRSNQMNPMRMLVMLAALWAAGTWLFAAESTPPTQSKPAPAKATPAPAEAQAQPGAPSQEEVDAALATANAATAEGEEPQAEPQSEPKDDSSGKQASTADKAGTPQRFVPSEQVRADFDVSFPIDI